MNFKIIATGHEYPDVLLFRERSEDGLELVVIRAIGVIDNDDDMFAQETNEFDRVEAAQDFIRDYTVASAERFCRRQGVTYQSNQ